MTPFSRSFQLHQSAPLRRGWPASSRRRRLVFGVVFRRGSLEPTSTTLASAPWSSLGTVSRFFTLRPAPFRVVLVPSTFLATTRCAARLVAKPPCATTASCSASRWSVAELWRVSRWRPACYLRIRTIDRVTSTCRPGMVAVWRWTSLCHTSSPSALQSQLLVSMRWRPRARARFRSTAAAAGLRALGSPFWPSTPLVPLTRAPKTSLRECLRRPSVAKSALTYVTLQGRGTVWSSLSRSTLPGSCSPVPWLPR